MDALSQIARTILYEGYILWPYCRTAMKNQQRWTFGGVYPSAFAEKSGDRDRVRTECLVEADIGASLNVSVRFLHVVARQVMALDNGCLVPVDQLTVGTERFLSWDEATEREWSGAVGLTDTPSSCSVPLVIAAAHVDEPLTDSEGARVGALRRSWDTIHAKICITIVPCGAKLYRVSVEVSNNILWQGTQRTDALRHTLVSVHAVLCVDQGSFVSLTDPPGELASAAALCRNDGMWPVLVGEDGARDTILASPIILEDYPRVAPESPGDMFDGSEIDQMLVLNVLTLSDAEQREMRDSDPRAREILDRCTSMSPDDLMRLHGTIRSIRPLAAG